MYRAMIISASIVMKPRTRRICEGNHGPHAIEGVHVRLYGRCETDVPSLVWQCADAARNSPDVMMKLSPADCHYLRKEIGL